MSDEPLGRGVGPDGGATLAPRVNLSQVVVFFLRAGSSAQHVFS